MAADILLGIVSLIAGALMITFSPVRLVRKMLFGTAFAEDPESLWGTTVLWFFDICSWLLLIIGAVILFRLVMDYVTA